MGCSHMSNSSTSASNWSPTEVERLHQPKNTDPSHSRLSADEDIELCRQALHGASEIEVVEGESSDQHKLASHRFENPRFVGSGSFGIVFFVFDKKLDIDVAIKLLRPSRNSPVVCRRFLDEAKITANLNHPGIIRLFESGTIGGIPYITSAVVPDGSLADLIAKHPHGIAPQRAVELIVQVTEAVAYAHSKLTYHRDIKPSNVLIQNIGTPESGDKLHAVLTDFGLAKRWDKTEAKLTVDGDILGTTRYMSPEQASGDLGEFGVASEVFTLGIILFELLTGKVPFEGKTNTEVRRSIVQAKQLPLKQRLADKPRDLLAIVSKCLQLSPKDRYESAAQLLKDLQRYLNRQPVEASAPSILRLVTWKAKQHPLGTGLVFFTLLTIVASTLGISWAFWQQYQASLREHATKIEYVRLFGKLIDDVVAEGQNQQAAILESLEAFQNSLAQDLGQNPNDQNLLHLQSLIYHYQSVVSTRNDNHQKAAGFRVQSIAILHTLKNRYPDNSKYRFQYIFGINSLLSQQAHATPTMLEQLPLKIDWQNRTSLAYSIIQEIDQLLSDFPNTPRFQDAANAFRLDMAEMIHAQDTKRSLEIVESAINDSISLANGSPNDLTYIKPAILGYRRLAKIAHESSQTVLALQRIADAEGCFETYLQKHDLPWVLAIGVAIQAEKMEYYWKSNQLDDALSIGEKCLQTCQNLSSKPTYEGFSVIYQFHCTSIQYQISLAQSNEERSISLQQDLEACALTASKREDSRSICKGLTEKFQLPTSISQILTKQ